MVASCRKSHALVDVNGLVVGYLLAGAGDAKAWREEVGKRGTEVLAAASESVGKTKKTWDPTRRGDFKYVNTGYSFGGGSLVGAARCTPFAKLTFRTRNPATWTSEGSRA